MDMRGFHSPAASRLGGYILYPLNMGLRAPHSPSGCIRDKKKLLRLPEGRAFQRSPEHDLTLLAIVIDIHKY
jgi:hypothetical protein